MIPALGAGFAIYYLVDLQPIFRLIISCVSFFGIYFVALFVQKEPFLYGVLTTIKNKILRRKASPVTAETEAEEIFTDEKATEEEENKHIEHIVDEIVEEVEKEEKCEKSFEEKDDKQQ